MLAFPFVKLFQNNQLICFEMLATVLSQYCVQFLLAVNCTALVGLLSFGLPKRDFHNKVIVYYNLFVIKWVDIFNPFKSSGVKWSRFIVFGAILV